VALENGWANERRIAARGEAYRQELRKQRCRPKPIQHLRCRCDHTGNSAHAGVEAAAHRVLAPRATAVLRRIRVRTGRGLAMRRHQGGGPRKCDHGPLQADGEHHDESDELALHMESVTAEARRSKSSAQKAPSWVISVLGRVPARISRQAINSYVVSTPFG
jgi:hypothetical protein